MVKLEDTVYFHFGTASASTGAATDADAPPTVTVEEDGVAIVYAPTVTNVTTGLYRVTCVCSAANGFETGKRYSLYAVATVGGITGRDSIAEFDVTTNMLDDIAAAVWAEVLEGTLTAKQFQRIMLAALAGTSSDSGKEFYDLTGTKKRIDGTMVGADRTVSTLDGS